MHWDSADKPLVEFTSAVAKLRQLHPTFRRKRFFTGTTVRTGDGKRLNDIVWLHLDGRAMEQDDWTSGSQAIGMYLNGDGIAGKDARGRTITDDHFLIYFNADGAAEVTLPPDEFARAWDVVIDTSGAADTASTMAASKTFQIATRTVVVLQEHAEPEDEPDHSVAASIAALAQTGATSPAAEQRSGSRPTKSPDS